MVSDLGENSRVHESRKDIAYVDLVVCNDKTNVNVAIVASTLQKAIELVQASADKLRFLGDRYDDVAKISHVRTIAFSEEVTMPEQKVVPPVGVPTYGYGDRPCDCEIYRTCEICCPRAKPALP